MMSAHKIKALHALLLEATHLTYFVFLPNCMGWYFYSYTLQINKRLWQIHKFKIKMLVLPVYKIISQTALQMRAADKRPGAGQDPAMKAPDVVANAPKHMDGQTLSLLEQESPGKPYLSLWFLSSSSVAGRGLCNQVKKTKTQNQSAYRIPV